MNRNFCIYILLLFFLSGCRTTNDQDPIYRDPNQPVEKRTADLMARMTLEEKVAQMCPVCRG